MLNFNGAWRFDSPGDIPEKNPSRLRLDLQRFANAPELPEI